MTKRKSAAKAAVKPDQEKDESYLDYLGIGGEDTKDKGDGDSAGKKADEPSVDDRISSLLTTIEGLNSRMDGVQNNFMQLMANPAQTSQAPAAPTLKEVALDGLPDPVENPEGYAKGLNDRITSAVQENVQALSTFNSQQASAAQAQEGRGDQLWADFQDLYMDKLETDLPDAVDVSAQVEVAARNVAKKAVRRGIDLDRYMYGSSDKFMQDVFTEAERILSPFRKADGDGDKGGDGPTPEEVEAHRTGGIIGDTGVKSANTGDAVDKGSLISDLQELQKASGFY